MYVLTEDCVASAVLNITERSRNVLFERRCLCFHDMYSLSDEHAKLEQRRQWLDSEVEKVLKRKEAMETLEEELKRREAIILNKEAMLAEKSELEMKKLRSSQVLTKVWV